MKRYTLADLYVDPNKHIERCNECGAEPRWESLERHRLYCENCHQIGHPKTTHCWYERNDTIDEWNRMNHPTEKGGVQE